MVERGYSDSQRTTVTSVGGWPSTPAGSDVASPAVVVIGEVARFAAEQVGARLRCALRRAAVSCRSAAEVNAERR